ncbi:MAG: helix-turn-helix domain-containing protein [Phycisphaerales bacterium]
MGTTRFNRPFPPAAERATSEPPPLITAGELAVVLGVSTHTVCHWARTGRIPCLRVGQKTLRFDRAAVLAAIRDGHAAEGGAA